MVQLTLGVIPLPASLMRHYRMGAYDRVEASVGTLQPVEGHPALRQVELEIFDDLALGPSIITPNGMEWHCLIRDAHLSTDHGEDFYTLSLRLRHGNMDNLCVSPLTDSVILTLSNKPPNDLNFEEVDSISLKFCRTDAAEYHSHRRRPPFPKGLIHPSHRMALNTYFHDY